MCHARCVVAVAVAMMLPAAGFAQPAIPFADAGIHAVHFVDQSEGWAVGDDGVIWHSMDGGKTWERQPSATRASLRGVHFITPYTGWVVGRTELPGGGSVGVMLRTTDGGMKWEEMGTNVLPGLHTVKFFGEKTGFVCGDGSAAFPSGLFTTADGGRTWKPVPGAKLASCRGADFRPGSQQGVVAGAWGRLGTIAEDGVYRESDTDPLAGRTLHAVTWGCTINAKAYPPVFAVGDGGAVLSSTDGGKSWGFVNLGLSPEVVANCDFRCCGSFGDHVWAAGKPGGFVLHSADRGATWEIQKTELPVPVNGMYFLTDRIGWMVGELGCILGTIDGGKTWKVQQAGGLRAAVLFLHATPAATPLDVASVLGHGEGYRCVAVSLMSADPATSDPKRAADAARLRQAMRLSGGVSGDVGWAFPLGAHASGLPPRELMMSWDGAHGGKAADQLLRQAVLAIRMWQPEVIVADSLVGAGSSPDALALHAAKEAFNKAADEKCFPEQITTLGLKPWSAKKLYAMTSGAKGAQVTMDQSVYSVVLDDSPRDFAEPATRLLPDDAVVVDRRAFALVAHRLQDAERHTAIMEGIILSRGSSARRLQANAPVHAAVAAEKQKATQSRRRLETMANFSDPEFAGSDKLIGILESEIKRFPDDMAARTVHAIAMKLVGEGKWIEACELHGRLVLNYPGHPLAIESFRWLTRYHAGSETRRRTEIQHKLLIKNVSFDALSGDGKVQLAGGSGVDSGKPTVQEDRYGFYSPDAVRKWHQSCLDLEPKMIAFGPVHSRDPAAWLCFLAARRHLGKHEDAIGFVRDYFKHTPGAAAQAPGIDAWRDCLAAELWMTDRSLVPVQPKPTGFCKATEVRPLLDGKLDDACWRTASPMILGQRTSGNDSSSTTGGENAAFRTESRFTYDERYLYIAITCLHPSGMRVEPAAKRARDADLAGRDRVDILLDLDRDYQTYYRFQIDQRGCLAEDCWGDKSWNPKYFVAFQSTESGWSAELAIPIDELTSERPSHGKTWAANVTRVTPGKGIQSWSGPADHAPRPEGMGLLQFRADK